MPDNPREKYADLRERLVANSMAWPEGSNDPCWEWTGRRSRPKRPSRGVYGRFNMWVHQMCDTLTFAPHRVMFALFELATAQGKTNAAIDDLLDRPGIPMDEWPEFDLSCPPPQLFSEEDRIFQFLQELRESGHEIDHICANGLCINPYHLQAVTGQKNIALRDERRAKDNTNVAIKEVDTYKRLTPHFVGITALFPRRTSREKIEKTEMPQIGFDFDAVATTEAPVQARTSAAVISLPVRPRGDSPKISPDDQGNIQQLDAYRKTPRLKR